MLLSALPLWPFLAGCGPDSTFQAIQCTIESFSAAAMGMGNLPSSPFAFTLSIYGIATYGTASTPSRMKHMHMLSMYFATHPGQVRQHSTPSKSQPSAVTDSETCRVLMICGICRSCGCAHSKLGCAAGRTKSSILSSKPRCLLDAVFTSSNTICVEREQVQALELDLNIHPGWQV